MNLKGNESNIDEEKLSIQEAKLVSFNNDSIGIEYKILNNKKLIYHKTENDDGY